MNIASHHTIAVLGYGSQGRAQAHNLRDSGYKVIIGVRTGGPSFHKAQADGFDVRTIEQAVLNADVIAMLTPDMTHQSLYKEIIEPILRPGACLVFAHGLTIHAQLIIPRSDIDVVLVAPKGPGSEVRNAYINASSVACVWSIHQDYSRQAQQRAFTYAAGLGVNLQNIIKTTFKEETEADLFGEQAVLCGGVCALAKAGFETLVEAGYQPEIAYFEVFHEIKLIVDLLHEGGLTRMLDFISETAQYGHHVSGPRIINAETKQRMKEVLNDIQNGAFTKQWVAEHAAGLPNYMQCKKADLQHPLEIVGRALRQKITSPNPTANLASTEASIA